MTYLSDELYEAITNSIPLVCIDVIPVRLREGAWEVGIITRATGKEAGKPAIAGGRIQHNETITQAISRHILADWNVADFAFFAGNSVSRPFYVQQYKHQDAAGAPFGYDPTKHSIGLTFLIELSQSPEPRNEASAFYWIDIGSIPASSAFNQHLLMAEAHAFLATAKK